MAECYTTPQNPGDAPESTAENMKQSEVIEYIATAGGWIIVPSSPPANMDFEATTFGSSTSCKVVTNLCDIVQPTETIHVAFVTHTTLLEYKVITNHTGSSGNRSVTPAVGLVGPEDRGDLFTSILSCTTTLSDV
ncbi:MAG: hypothetical protein L6R42_003090, partial [Xanthoria sp. 1 TBL-2021]